MLSNLTMLKIFIKFPFKMSTFSISHQISFFFLSPTIRNTSIVFVQKFRYGDLLVSLHLLILKSPKSNKVIHRNWCVCLKSSHHLIYKTKKDRITKFCIQNQFGVQMSFLSLGQNLKIGNRTRNEYLKNSSNDFFFFSI